MKMRIASTLIATFGLLAVAYGQGGDEIQEPVGVLVFDSPQRGFVHPRIVFAKDAPKILLLEPPKDTPIYGVAMKKTTATAEAYRESGNQVEIVYRDEFDSWLMKEGKKYRKANIEYQRIGFAKHEKVDGIGGFEGAMIARDFEKPETESPMMGTWFVNLRSASIHSWGYSESWAESEEASPIFGRPPQWKTEGEYSFYTEIRATVIKPISEAGGTAVYEDTHRPRRIIGIVTDGSITITEIMPESPAEKAGLMAGDKIILVDGEAPKDQSAISSAVNNSEDNEIEIRIDRQGTLHSFTITAVGWSEFQRKKRAERCDEVLANYKGEEIDGEPFTFDSLKGKIVILEFWGPWCGPCVYELPSVILAAEHFDDVELVMICTHCDKDELKTFIEDNQLPGIHIADDELARDLFVSSFPTTFLIDEDGKLATETTGRSLASAIVGLKKQSKEKK